VMEGIFVSGLQPSPERNASNPWRCHGLVCIGPLFYDIRKRDGQVFLGMRNSG